MGTFLVVVTVNVGKDREFKVVEILKETSIGFFEFKILEETFRNGIVVRMPLFGKGLNNRGSCPKPCETPKRYTVRLCRNGIVSLADARAWKRLRRKYL